MKKRILICSIMLIGGLSAHGQSAATPITVETVTSLKPNDGIVVVYNSKADYDAEFQSKSAEYKTLIVEFQNNPEKATFYREELWRLENARIEIK